jgi:N-acetyl-anhydromuramyl-L-alanine amidase AmpD
MTYATVYTEVEVDVNLNEFETDDLISELEDRGYMVGSDNSEDSNELLTKIWQLRRNGQNYDRELDQLIYTILGKIV